jgi:hypothetical protein
MTSAAGQLPWYDVRDADMADLSDAALDGYIRQWSTNLEEYRRQAREGGGPRHPGDKGPGFSAWWAGKILDRGLREHARRRYRAQATAQHPHATPDNGAHDG